MSSTNTDTVNRFAGRTKKEEDPFMKSLRIKVSGLKRNIKDLEFAKKEVICETERLNTIKQRDPDRVKQQENVLGEAQMMIPHSENRLRAAIKDLKEFLHEGETLNEDNELLQSAKQAIEEGNLALSQV